MKEILAMKISRLQQQQQMKSSNANLDRNYKETWKTVVKVEEVSFYTSNYMLGTVEITVVI